jgi:hypothetical protein
MAEPAPPARTVEAVAALVLGWFGTRLLLLVQALDPAQYSGAILGDVLLYAARVERMFQGEVPYRDIAIEYPPGSVPFTLLPGIVGGTGAGYRLAFALTMLAVDALGLYLAVRLRRTIDPGRWRIPVAYLVGVFLVGPLLLVRFDAVPAVCVLAAAVLAVEGRVQAAAAALGYGTAAKLFPAVCLPLLVIGVAPALGWGRALKRTLPGFLVALCLPVVPALLLSFDGTVASVLLYHARRGVQVESLWANGIALAHVLGGLDARTVYEFGALHVASGLSSWARALSTPLTLAAVAAAAALVWRRTGLVGPLRGADWTLAFALGLLAFMLPSKVLSPQYLLWLLPLVATLVADEATWPAFWAALAAGPLTQLVFPFRYDRLLRLEAEGVWLLTARNALLVVVAAVVARALWRDREPVAAAGPADPEPSMLDARGVR